MRPRLVTPFLAGLVACSSTAPAVERMPSPSVAQPLAAGVTATALAAPPPTPMASEEPPAPAPELPKGLVVLVVGDSFAEAIGFGLNARQQEFGLRVVMRGKQSTYIPQWAGMEFGLDRLVAQTSPDVVIVALGGNELAMPNPEVSRSSVAKVVKLIGDRPCVWATPLLRGPNDSRVLEAIRTESRPCRFFDSAKHAPDVPRGGDRIHPTIEGQRLWAGAIVEWLRKEHVVGPEAAPFALRARPADE